MKYKGKEQVQKEHTRIRKLQYKYIRTRVRKLKKKYRKIILELIYSLDHDYGRCFFEHPVLDYENNDYHIYQFLS